MKAVSLSVVFYCIVNWIHAAREWKNYTRGFAACLCWFDGRAKLQQPRQPQQSKDKEWSRAKAQVLHTIKWQSVVLRPNKLFIGNARLISHENLAKVISPAINAHYIKYIYIQINISFLAAVLLSKPLNYEIVLSDTSFTEAVVWSQRAAFRASCTPNPATCPHLEPTRAPAAPECHCCFLVPVKGQQKKTERRQQKTNKWNAARHTWLS